MLTSDKSLYFIPIRWIHNESMYVRFGVIRNTKTWSKSKFSSIVLLNTVSLICVQLSVLNYRCKLV